MQLLFRMTTLFGKSFFMTFRWLSWTNRNEFAWPIGIAPHFSLNKRNMTCECIPELVVTVPAGCSSTAKVKIVYTLTAHINYRISQCSCKNFTTLCVTFLWLSRIFHDLCCFPWLSRPGIWSSWIPDCSKLKKCESYTVIIHVSRAHYVHTWNVLSQKMGIHKRVNIPRPFFCTVSRNSSNELNTAFSPHNPSRSMNAYTTPTPLS